MPSGAMTTPMPSTLVGSVRDHSHWPLGGVKPIVHYFFGISKVRFSTGAQRQADVTDADDGDARLVGLDLLQQRGHSASREVF